MTKTRYVYGPVRSWRSGTSLGIDPIGEVSTCSFNCAYCQLGKIQEVTTEIKDYVPVADVIQDLRELEAQGQFNYDELDVITFAGSGEPTLAANLGEMIDAIRELYKDRQKQVPISILTNATLLNDPAVRERAARADLISLKLDAPNDQILRSINQPAAGVTIETIKSGIKNLALDCHAGARNDGHCTQLQLQIMIMPKFLADDSYVEDMAALIKELGISKLQINTPTRAKPVSKTGEYWLDTRGNHYGPGQADEIKPDYIEFTELPVISREQAMELEAKLRQLLSDLPELEIINVYK